MKHEVLAIEAVCAKKYSDKRQNPPKLVVIICGKRHRTRFYPTKEDDADRMNQNTKNGVSSFHCTRMTRLYVADILQTVVDRGVTSEKFWDFFVQPHAAIKGTVSTFGGERIIFSHILMFFRPSLAIAPSSAMTGNCPQTCSKQSRTIFPISTAGPPKPCRCARPVSYSDPHLAACPFSDSLATNSLLCRHHVRAGQQILSQTLAQGVAQRHHIRRRHESFSLET